MNIIDRLRNPVSNRAQLVCLAIVLVSAAYFVVYAVKFFGNVDFSASGLGTSEIADFFVFYSGARFLWEGGAVADLYNGEILKGFQVSLGAASEGLHPFNYPPTYLLLLWPFGALPYGAALVIWQALTLFVFALVLHRSGFRPLEVLAAAAAPVTIVNLSGGQNGCLTSALIIGGLVMLSRRQVGAGCLFGLLTFKPHLGLLLPLACLAERRWITVTTAAAVAVFMIIASLAAFGGQSWSAYFEFFNRFQEEAQAQTGGRFLDYSATVLMALQLMQVPDLLGKLIQLTVTIGVGLLIYKAYRQPVDRDLKLALLLIGISLVTPFGFVYDLPIVAVAVILVVRLGIQNEFLPYELLCLSMVWVLPFFNHMLAQKGFSLAPWMHLLLFFFVLVRIHRNVRSADVAVAHDGEPGVRG